MAKYTIELRHVCEIYGRDMVESWFKEWDLSDYLTNDEIDVINSRGIFNKDKLAKQIVEAYLMREIGQETPALFRFYAKNKMAQLMEEYAPLIYSSAIKYDPLINVDYTESFTRNIARKNESSGNNSATGLTVNSDTPQGQINKEQILSGEYASSVQAGDSSTNASSNEDENTDETYSKNIKGNSGISATAQKMIEQYRNNIRAINREIIEKLNILFMGLF